MKSAIELAMERTRDPNEKPLTDRQREEIAELRKIYEGKIAEKEIMLDSRLKEREELDPQQVELLKEELTNIKNDLNAEMEDKIEKVRQKG